MLKRAGLLILLTTQLSGCGAAIIAGGVVVGAAIDTTTFVGKTAVKGTAATVKAVGKAL